MAHRFLLNRTSPTNSEAYNAIQLSIDHILENWPLNSNYIQNLDIEKNSLLIG